MKNIAKIFLINPEKQVLLVLRDNKTDITYPNYWSEIGGEIEPGETPLTALRREIKEEISCEVYNIQYLGEAFDYHVNCKIIFFKGNVFDELQDIRIYEGQRLNFFSFDEIKNLLIPAPPKDFMLNNWDRIFT